MAATRQADVRPVRSMLVWVAELSAALSAGGFLLSAIVNTIAFREWGLNYLQLATPTDVIMGGLAYALAASPFLIAVAVGFTVGRLLGGDTFKRLAIYITTISILMLVAYFFVTPRGIILVLAAPGLLALLSPLFYRPEALSIAAGWRRNGLVTVAALWIICLGALVIWMTLESRILPRPGLAYIAGEAPSTLSFGGDGLETRGHPECYGSYIEWFGSAKTVLRCETGRWVVPSDQVIAVQPIEPVNWDEVQDRLIIMDPSDTWDAPSPRAKLVNWLWQNIVIVAFAVLVTLGAILRKFLSPLRIPGQRRGRRTMIHARGRQLRFPQIKP